MNVKLVGNPGVAGGNDKGLSINGETDVADKPLVENPVNQLTIVNTAFVKAFERGALGLGEVHGRES